MVVTTVRTKQDMKVFITLPAKIHADNLNYVPPIWMDEKNAYQGKNNPILKNSDYELFLVVDDHGTAVARTVVYIDHNHNAFYQAKIGFFGAFDCANDQEAGKMLVQTIEKWLKEKGMDIIRGPIHPVAENWGFVLEGYDSPPVFMSPWNPEYYHSFFQDYNKAKDLLVYEADMRKGYTLPARYQLFFEKFLIRYPGIHFRKIDIHHMKKDAKAILDISNIAYADNWGYVPLELPVMEDMLNKLKMIVDPDAVWMVENNHTVVGYCLGFPDINLILKRIKGRLFPFGWARLLVGCKKLKEYRLFGLAVHPDWQSKGLDAMMYVNLYIHLVSKNIRMEANYILEDNDRIKNSLEKLGMQHIKTYRIYEKML